MPTKTKPQRDKTDHAIDHPCPEKYSRARFRGVAILAPEGRRTRWAFRYRDPDLGRLVQRSLHPDEQRTERTIEAAAKALFVRVLHRRQEVRMGAATISRAQLAAVLERYYAAVQHAPKTLVNYRQITRALEQWCAGHQIKTIDQLTRGRLREFAVSRQHAGRLQIVKGGRKGQRKPVKKPRANSTINRELRALRSVFQELRRLELTALTSEQIKDSLLLLPETHERKPHLSLEQCRELLEACRAHDMDQKNLKAAMMPVAFLLFTGMRVSEACAITGRDCDPSRNVIVVKAANEKRRRTRDVDCGVSLTLTIRLPQWALKGSGKVLSTTPQGISQMLAHLADRYGGPKCNPHMLRRTCGTILACSNIFEAATLHRTAGQLGHSQTMCERRYAGQMRCPDGDTLEEVIGLNRDDESVVVLGDGDSFRTERAR